MRGHRATDGLHFLYDRPIMPHGVGWALPRGKEISLGLGSYRGAQSMRRPLEVFIRKVLEGNWTLKKGLAKYAAFVQKQKCFFDIFSTAQEVLTRLPPVWVDRIAPIVVRERTRKWLFRRYWELTAAWTRLDSRGQPIPNASIV